jgi:nitrogen fixation NifU-like protein
MKSPFYSRKALELFLSPPYVGEVVGADGRGEAVNPACSDHTVVTLRVEEGRLTEVLFQTQGCAAAIASSAATVLLARGLRVEEAEAITVADVVAYLEGLPESKVGCSVIAPEALRRALSDWRGRGGEVS